MPKVKAGQIFATRFISVISNIEWRVDKLEDILQQDGDEFRSNPIVFCSGRWLFNMKRLRKNRNVHLLSILMNRFSNSSHTNHVECQLIKINSDGAEDVLTTGKAEANKGNWQSCMTLDVYDRNVKRSDETVLHLKVVCSLECIECKTGEARNYPRLMENQKIIAKDRGGNLKIFVRGSEFTVHEAIMRHYSPVFDAMLRHDMLESNTKEVYITDCDPEAFSRLLKSFYLEEMYFISMDAVYSLYPLTDKYEASAEKKKCVKFMLQNLDLETFWEILTLALRHSDLELRDGVNRFFADNWKEITLTRRWLNFREEHPSDAEDFFMDSCTK